jgi:hypothetical protein
MAVSRGGAVEEMITGAQIRAARLLLGWTSHHLADRAKLRIETIRRSEATDGEPMVTMGHAIAIRYTLERAGVIFVEDGVKLRKGGK